LRLWQRRQHRRYRAWENKQRLQRIGHGLIWPIRILFALAVVALVLWLGIPIVGLSVALLLAFLMWIVMGAAWL